MEIFRWVLFAPRPADTDFVQGMQKVEPRPNQPEMSLDSPGYVAADPIGVTAIARQLDARRRRDVRVASVLRDKVK